MNLREKNTLIAKFMELIPVQINYSNLTVKPHIHELVEGFRLGKTCLDVANLPENLPYQNSWEHLMHVWVEIGKLRAPENGAGITVLSIELMEDTGDFRAILNYRIKFAAYESKHKWIEKASSSPFFAVYDVIIEFLQFYNKKSNIKSKVKGNIKT